MLKWLKLVVQSHWKKLDREVQIVQLKLLYPLTKYIRTRRFHPLQVIIEAAITCKSVMRREELFNQDMIPYTLQLQKPINFPTNFLNC